MRQDGYTFIPRLRYNISFSMPLKGKELVANTPFVVLSNEVFFNFGKNAIYNTFDQNRLTVGLGYQVNAKVNVQLGYLNVFQQEVSGSNYVTSHSIRAFLFHNIDFRD